MTWRAGLAAALLAACGDVVGFGGPPVPLATVRIEVTGTPAPAAAHLRVALVWGAQWLPEPFCVLPPESAAAAAVIQAGCADPFGFVPSRVAASVAATPGVPVGLELFDLPGADVMVGDVTARVAYGSLVVFDDRNGSGSLELRRGSVPVDADGGVADPDAGVPDPGPGGGPDVVYGASLFSMTLPDQRLAFREGGFDATAAFYPRSGCPAPPAGFSVLSAGGFPATTALAAALAGMLPPEDPATCGAGSLATTVVTIAVQPPDTVAQLACQRGSGGATRYRKPPAVAPDLAGQTWVCAAVPTLGAGTGGPGTGQKQLVFPTTSGPSGPGPAEQPCKALVHHTLVGCSNDAACTTPQWDLRATPPAWWPCSP